MIEQLIGKDTAVLIQGITGRQGTKISREMLDYGTNVLAGVTPGKKGHTVHGIPVYDTTEEALERHPEINTSLILVPRDAAREAAFEAMDTGRLRLVNILTEGIPQKDSAAIVQKAKEKRVRVVGPASVGIIVPDLQIKLGAIGGNDPGIFYNGSIALFSKSGGMCLSIATEVFNRLGYGTSIVVGVGGDRITGTTFVDLLEIVRDDDRTALVILMGEVGGTYEEEAAEYIRASNYPKPVVVRLTGVGAQHLFPKGSRMGHAGAIINQGNIGTFESKIKAFEAAGVPVAKDSDELIHLVEKKMPGFKAPPDLDSAVAGEMELVSISKAKLESMKGQIRAVQVRTGLTKLSSGTPYFRGYALPELIERASIPDMIGMALRKEEPSGEMGETVQRATRRILAGTSGGASSEADAKDFQALIACKILDRESVITEDESLSGVESEALAIHLAVIDAVASALGNGLDFEKVSTLEGLIFQALKGREPSREEADVIRALYVACVDHTPATPSSLAALACYSGGASLKDALAASFLAMGHVHAGAGEAMATMIGEYLEPFREKGVLEVNGLKIETIDQLSEYLVDKYTGFFGGEKRKIPGYGHRYYSMYRRDPRAETVLQVVRKNNLESMEIDLALKIEEVLKRRKSAGLCINVDGAIGAIVAALGLKPQAGKALFIIPRSLGILAQLLEQEAGSFFRLSNESVIYTGPKIGREGK